MWVVLGLLFLLPTLVLIGWISNNIYLKSVVPGFTPMNPLTLVCFLLIGSALASVLLKYRHSQRMVRFAGAFVLVVGSLMLMKYIAGIDLHIDQLLFYDRIGKNRIAPNTAFNFLLIGSILLTYKIKYRPIFYILLGINAFISVLSIVGYLYGLRVLFGIANFTPMAIHTAACFLLVDVLIIKLVFKIGRLYIDKRIILSLGLTLLIITVMGVGTQNTINQIKLQQANLARTDEISNSVKTLRTSLVDAETGQRGYLLTGQLQYLEPYTNAYEKINTQLIRRRRRYE